MGSCLDCDFIMLPRTINTPSPDIIVTFSPDIEYDTIQVRTKFSRTPSGLGQSLVGHNAGLGHQVS